MTAIDIIVSVEDDCPWPVEAKTAAIAAAQAAFAAISPTINACYEIGVTLADDAVVHALNREHRGHDRPTNVLSFPLCAPDDEPPEPGAPLLLGDVILAYETVLTETKLQNKTLMNHLSHLVVHGVLHLFGYDHETDDDAETMETQEIRILARLGVSNPYHAASLASADAPPPINDDESSAFFSAPIAISHRQ
ncbi:Endoribonuclease YbeY [Azospirillaceae bacterium]